jgi:hypothetical protein
MNPDRKKHLICIRVVLKTPLANPQFWSSLVAHARGVPRSHPCEREFFPPFSSPRSAVIKPF